MDAVERLEYISKRLTIGSNMHREDMRWLIAMLEAFIEDCLEQYESRRWRGPDERATILAEMDARVKAKEEDVEGGGDTNCY